RRTSRRDGWERWNGSARELSDEGIKPASGWLSVVGLKLAPAEQTPNEVLQDFNAFGRSARLFGLARPERALFAGWRPRQGGEIKLRDDRVNGAAAGEHPMQATSGRGDLPIHDRAVHPVQAGRETWSRRRCRLARILPAATAQDVERLGGSPGVLE